MRPTSALLALLLPALAAGCLAPAPPPGAGPALEADPARGVVPEPIALHGCSMAIGFFPIPMEAAMARMPDGFTPVAYGAAPSGQARAGAWVWECGEVEGATGGWRDAQATILVVPPSEWAAEGAAFHAILLEGANDRADMVARYAAWNVAVKEGPVRLERSSAGPATLVSATADMPSGRLALDVRAAPQSSGDGGVVRAFAVEGGVAVGAFEYQWTPYEYFGGVGTLREGASIYGVSGTLAGTAGLETGAGYDFVLQPVALPPRTEGAGARVGLG